MNWFDLVVLAILAVSVALGVWRGLVREVFSLAGWLAATGLAVLFAADAAALVPAELGTPFARSVMVFLVIFFVVLIGTALGGLLLSKALRAVGLGLADRTLGAIFGLARGALILLVVVLLAGLTTLPREPFWREASLAPPLETAVIAVKPHLPRPLAERVRYGR